ncbi:TPA: hypothetical protein QC364_005733, partial [Bacillus cereus]|nr:hypothetical protein [Bacillus cereus]
MNYLFLILFVFLIFMSAIHVGIYGRFKFYGLDNRKSVKYAVSLPFYIIKIAFLLYRDAKKAKKKKAYLYLLFPIRKFWEVVTVFVMVRVKIEAEYEVAQELLSELREQTKKKNRLANIVKEDKLLKI